MCQAFPSIERVRLVNSGTEATMSAIRLARGYTGRDTIVKFEGCYHGHADGLLVKSGSGTLTFGTPASLGVPQDYVRHTICLPYNNIDAVRDLCRAAGREIACIIVEPVAANMGLVPPKEGFLQGLREICDSHGILLIFDEVITGLRLAWGGAQELYGVMPDLTTLGKVLGGGLPVGAYGGRAEIMDAVSPVGGVYQAGTLSGNPLAVAAGIAAVTKLRDGRIYAGLEEKGAALEDGLRLTAGDANLDICLTRAGSLLCVFFTAADVYDLDTAKTSDTVLFGRFFHEMLKRGIYIAPSQFEAWFISAAHTAADIDETLDAAGEAFAALRGY